MSTKFQWSLEWELSKTQSKKLVIWLLLWLLIAWRGHPLDSTQTLLATYSHIPRNTNPTISFLTYIVHVCLVLSHVWLFATLWTVAPRLLCLWDSPGKNTGVCCHFLHQGICPTQRLNLHLLGLLHCRQIPYPLSHQGHMLPPCICQLLTVENDDKEKIEQPAVAIPFYMCRMCTCACTKK